MGLLRLLSYCVLGTVVYRCLKRIFGGEVRAYPSQSSGRLYYPRLDQPTPYYEYQHINVYPEAHEINVNSSPNLEPNIVKGPFKDIYHYLDIHFRLLREDFLRPLRQDITCYLKNENAELQNIQLHSVIFFRKGITIYDHNCYCLKIRESLTPLITEEEKRFMTGSIVIFTNDNFRTIFCGKVVRDDNFEEWQQLLVSFEGSPPIRMSQAYIMVEYRVFFEPYYNVLTVLQKISSYNFPLKEYLINANSTISGSPEYLTGIRYVLNEPHLNSSQLNALDKALKQKLALVQGPPGTGKTFVALKIAKKLLEVSGLWYKQTPMLIISFTNHALDQFLESLGKETKDILRLGGQSKNPSMKEFSFPEIRKRFYKTSNGMIMKKEFGKYYRQFTVLEKQIKDLEHYIDALRSGEDTTDIPDFSRIKCSAENIIRTMSIQRGYNVSDLYCLEMLIFNAKSVYQSFNAKQTSNQIEIMRSVKVIGLTTTCASRMRDTLEQLKSPIVIIEEAAEVLESHIISVLNQDCQHLIMIGDHLQLQPSTADYEIETEYKLGVSLFERMLNNGMQYHTLNVQHRMRPEISRLITPSVYPVLYDHDSVKSFPPVRGVSTPVFFINHKELENDAGVSSKQNLHEVEFFVQLALHLLRNEYKPEEITILAGYKGQVAALNVAAQRFRELKNVQVTSVDNFQGEENKIILLSLVRNNKQRKVGFLKTGNRVCVALSRAREGLYMMGNMTHLARSSKLWRDIQKTLESTNSVGRELPLVCQHHVTTSIGTPEDFIWKLGKYGGCQRLCRE